MGPFPVGRSMHLFARNRKSAKYRANILLNNDLGHKKEKAGA